MRRLLAPAALSLVLAACTQAAAPLRPNAIEQLPPDLGLDMSGARGAAVTFLEGYANAQADGARQLASAVGNPLIGRWVRWVSFQSELFPGRIDGEVEIRQLEFVDFLQLSGGGTGAQIDVDATLTFETTTSAGSPETFTRDFAGPFIVARRAPGEWLVLDATREGLSMLSSVYPVKGARAERGGLVVRLDSLFAFADAWQVNLLVRNRTGGVVGLRAKDVALVGPDGIVARGSALGVAQSLAAVPETESWFPGGVVFEPQEDLRSVVLLLPFRTADGEVALEFPIGELVKPDPGPVAVATAPLGAASG